LAETKPGHDMTIRHVIRAAGLMAGVLCSSITGCTFQHAESEPLPDPLVAPIPQAPPEGRAYVYPPTGLPPTVELVWRHGMPTGRVPSPHQAERFIVCVYDAQRGRCESGFREAVPRPIWLDAPADDPVIKRTPIKQKQLPFASSLDLQLGYEFRTHLRMRPEYRDRRLLWQVGACLGGTCRMSDPRSLRIGRVVEPIGD